MVKIIPLTQEQLAKAISLLEKIFSYKPDQKLLKYSLTDSLSKKAYGQTYWIAVDEVNSVIGITGLYDDTIDKKLSWLGWFGVQPDHRQRGVGSILLQYAIDKAKQRGSARLKLYTSSDPNERAAHHLYRKFGFEQTGIDRKADKVYFEKKLLEDTMTTYKINIVWDGPFKIAEIEKYNQGGSAPKWDGEDYGVYQIYGKHILCGEDALLYVGITTERTFTERFKEHKTWLLEDQDEKDIAIYLGRVSDPARYSEEDEWKSWKKDVELAEKILIYKYSPNYNSRELTIEPNLGRYKSVRLMHTGKSHKLKPVDEAPRDFHEW